MTKRKTYKFDPDWVIAPSETLKEWMEHNGMSVRVLAVTAVGRINRDAVIPIIEDVLNRRPMSHAHCDVLEAGTGIPARFWQALEHNYRVGLIAGKKDESDVAESR